MDGTCATAGILADMSLQQETVSPPPLQTQQAEEDLPEPSAQTSAPSNTAQLRIERKAPAPDTVKDSGDTLWN